MWGFLLYNIMVTTKIKIGEIIECEGKLYVIARPKSALDDVNEHGQIVFLLTEIP